MSPKVLLITHTIQKRPVGGRELLYKVNRDCLRNILGESLEILELDARPLTGMRGFLGAMRGHIDGWTPAVNDTALARIRGSRFDAVFIDGSNLGEAVWAIKREFPHVRAITFFHNVETLFFIGALRRSRSPKAVAVLLANYLAERKAVRASDTLIALSEIDSAHLRRIFGRAADVVFPMALEEYPEPPGAAEKAAVPREKYLLFVGGSFYANKAGIAWFIQNVAPRIHMKTIVVGKGMESLRAELSPVDNVEIVGGVDNVGSWYANAHVAIAPIFDGSGMKTKVAEALMFGKQVIGTKAAFAGYEDSLSQAGWTCDDAESFVQKIGELERVKLPHFNATARAVFDEKYSLNAACERLRRVIQNVST
jgi:glycosyltransferase involved in cell wall biosynthesis